jgi:hypothetical protein
MNKNIIIISIISVIVVGTSAFVLLNKNNDQNPTNAKCTQICADANKVCPSLIEKNNCEINCPDFSQETKEYLANAKSCEQLTEKPELLAEVIIPKINPPEQNEASNDCESACANYVNKCLTLVPNANQSLFQEGLNSCIGECASYDDNKINCLIDATDCPAMTEQCGL